MIFARLTDSNSNGTHTLDFQVDLDDSSLVITVLPHKDGDYPQIDLDIKNDEAIETLEFILNQLKGGLDG